MIRFIRSVVLLASILLLSPACSDEDVWTGPRKSVNLVREVKWLDECRLEYDSRNRISRVFVAYPSRHFYGTFSYEGKRMRFNSIDNRIFDRDAYVKARLNTSGYITSCEIWFKGLYDWEAGRFDNDIYACSYKFVYSPDGYLLRIEEDGQTICEYRWEHDNLVEIASCCGTRHRFEYNGMCAEQINLDLLYFNVYGQSFFDGISGGNMLRQLGCCNFFGRQGSELPVAFERWRNDGNGNWHTKLAGVYAYNVDARGVVTRMNFAAGPAVELSY